MGNIAAKMVPGRGKLWRVSQLHFPFPGGMIAGVRENVL